MRYFKEEYEQHVNEKVCRAKECKAMSKIQINPEVCKGCGLCQKNCPVSAIEGEGPGTKRVINQDKCIKCGTCIASCPFKAIS